MYTEKDARCFKPADPSVVKILGKENIVDTCLSAGLTIKETAVILEILEGNTTDLSIARALRIAPGTVNSHLSRIFLRFGYSSRLLVALKVISEVLQKHISNY